MVDYIYFIGASIIGLMWLLFAFKRRDLLKVQFIGSVYGVFFGFSENWFIPDYWTPPASLLNLIDVIGFGIESLMVGFFVGGLASVAYYVLTKKRVNGDVSVRWAALALLSYPLYGLLEYYFPHTTIYNMIGLFFSLALVLSVLESSSSKRALINSLFTGVLYIGMFFIFDSVFPEYIPSAYTGSYFSVLPFGLPIEELLFALSVGLFWGFIHYQDK